MGDYSDITFVKRRLRCAKRRAMYWSGIPSFNLGARAQSRSNGVTGHDFKYEMALDDVHSWSCELAKIEGKPEPDYNDYNPKRDFAEKFSIMMGEAMKRKGDKK